MSGSTFFRENTPGTKLNRSISEDFSFGGRSVRGSFLYGATPFGKKIPDASISTLPNGNARCSSWSPSGRYLAVGHVSNPYLTVYYFDGQNLVKLSDPATKPGSIVVDVEWTKDGKFLFVLELFTPFIRVYRIDDSSGVATLTLVSSGAAGLSEGMNLSFSPNGDRMVLAKESLNYVKVFDVVGSTLSTPRDIPPAVRPDVVPAACAWSPDGLHIAISTNYTPFLYVYYYDGSSGFNKIPNPVNLPPDDCYGLSWSPDGKYLAVSHKTGHRVTVYHFDGGVLTKIPNPTFVNPPDGTILDNAYYSGDGLGNCWSPDGRFLAFTLEASPWVRLYSFENGSLLNSAISTTLPTGKARHISWASDSETLCVSHNTHPHISVYKAASGERKPGNIVDIEPATNLPRI